MTYDDVLADRVRVLLAGEDGVSERAMFGGLGFMVRGNMALAASSTADLMVRVDPDRARSGSTGETVRPMEMRGRVTRGWLLVETAALEDDDEASGCGWTGASNEPSACHRSDGRRRRVGGSARLTTVSRR